MNVTVALRPPPTAVRPLQESRILYPSRRRWRFKCAKFAGAAINPERCSMASQPLLKEAAKTW